MYCEVRRSCPTPAYFTIVPTQMPEHVSKKLGEANLMYAIRRYNDAKRLLMEVSELDIS